MAPAATSGTPPAAPSAAPTDPWLGGHLSALGGSRRGEKMGAGTPPSPSAVPAAALRGARSSPCPAPAARGPHGPCSARPGGAGVPGAGGSRGEPGGPCPAAGLCARSSGAEQLLVCLLVVWLGVGWENGGKKCLTVQIRVRRLSWSCFAERVTHGVGAG